MGTRPLRTDAEVRALIAMLNRRALLGTVTEICRAYNVTLEAVLAGRRNPRIVQARDACIYRVITKTTMSTVETGELFSMDHTSILAARDRYIRRDMGKLLT